MSGHSKWHNIQATKGKADAKRSAIFTKIGREIAVAVKEGGADVRSNSKLAAVVAKAKANNMPNDNIDRSIKKASGELGSINYEEITYEGYAPGGVAMIVQTLTDNRNRTAGDVRHIFDKYGGSMGNSGCVSYMFDKKGVIAVESAGLDEDDFMMMALDAGADDIMTDDDVYVVYTAPTAFTAVRDALIEKGLTIISAELELIPQNTITPDEETIPKIQRFVDLFEENDDVQNVYHNANLPDEEEDDD